MADRPDSGWLRNSFLLPAVGNSVTARDYGRRVFNPGIVKFADTTLGGNSSINPLPQFTRHADLNERRVSDAGRGMGRYYSEVYDDSQIHVYMRMGVPSFTSMTSFLGNYYNSDAARLARSGRGTYDLMYSIAKAAGSIVTLRLMPIIFLFQALDFLMENQTTKFYFSKPAMFTYWNAVSSILNTLASNMGFVAGMELTEQQQDPKSNKVNSEEWNRLLPDIYNSNGSIDIFKVSTRYQRLARHRFNELQTIMVKRGIATPADQIKAIREKFLERGMYETPKGHFNSFDDYAQSFFGTSAYSTTPTDTNFTMPPEIQNGTEEEQKAWAASAVRASAETALTSDPSDQMSDLIGTADSGRNAGFFNFMQAEMEDGAQFISFRVDNPGTSSESFSNSTKESELANTMNSASNAMRSARFNLADGKFVGGIVGSVTGTIVDAVMGLAEGALASVSMSGIGQLAGNALVDIPKYWESSSSQLTRMNFTMQLRSPSGNDLARFQNLMVPLAMILATGLPRSTGFQSYTQPFLVELYCKGRCQTRLGLIDSISITRGTGNVGYTIDGKPLGIDITFSVVDLSSIMHMPINSGFQWTDILSPGQAISKHIFAQDNTFTDYLSVLGSLGLTEQVYVLSRLKRNIYSTMLKFDQWTSPAHFASWLSSGASILGFHPGRLASALFMPTERI